MSAKKKSRTKSRSKGRRNPDQASDFPIGETVAVESIRFNGDGTLTIAIADDVLAGALPASSANSARKVRTTRFKTKAKASSYADSRARLGYSVQGIAVTPTGYEVRWSGAKRKNKKR